MKAGASTPADTVNVRIIGHRGLRRLVITYGGARISLALCDCPPMTAAVEAAAILEWAWGVAPDESISAVVAALR